MKMAHAKSVERRRPFPLVIPHIECVDGYELSVQASSGHYCTPREDWPEAGWTHVEVMAEVNDPRWEPYDSYGVFGWVPLELVRQLIEDHGGVKRTHAIEQVFEAIEGDNPYRED